MSLHLITAPTEPVVLLADAKTHLRVEVGDENALIEAQVAAVANMLDPAGGGWLGRALRPQTWELRLPGFPCGEIALPYPPLISMTSFKYDDTAGVEQTLASTTGYRILGAGGLGKVMLAPPYGTSWPIARADTESVRVRYACGYPPTPADLLPPSIIAWIKVHLGTLYEQRETTVVGAPVASLPNIDGLIWPYRVF